MPGPNEPLRSEAGLCALCSHAQVQRGARDSRFWRCLRADVDDSLTRYPRLPTAECHGFERRAAPSDAEG